MEIIKFMKSNNFEFLRPHWPELASLAGYAEEYAFSDVQSSLIKLRCFSEMLVGIVYREFNLTTQPNHTFVDRLNAHNFTSMVDRSITDKLHAIRMTGNKAAHEGRFSKNDPLWLLKEAHILGAWLLLVNDKGTAAEVGLYQEPKKAAKDPDKSDANHKVQLEKVLAELKRVTESEQKAQKENSRIQRENERLQSEVSDKDQALAKQQLASQNRQRSDIARSQLELNEAETRRRLIDTELHSRGWDVDLIEGKSTEQVGLEVQVDGQPTPTGLGYCDYVLWGDDAKPLAVIEAKRTRENAEKGREQAKLYADSLERKHGQRPVIFYTNGHDISIWDDAQGYAPRKLYGFYSKDSLEYLIRQRSKRLDLTKTPIDLDIAGRDYQIETITRVSERFSQKFPKALVVQATGTGKTRIAIACTKRMLEAGWAKRVLFLCDRKELRKQAAKAYNEFLSEPLYVVGKSKKSDMKNARIYVATYPGMMTIMEQFDPGYFDLIIADESHRSIYNVYGDVFKYYDALQIGLTATPVEMISRSTSQLFGCDYKLATANYPLEKAVEDKNLVPFKVVTHTTQFLRDGINAKTLDDEQIAQLEEDGIDPNTLDFDANVIDKAIYNRDTNRAILKNLMENGLRLADGQTLGKSMLFARNIKHARILNELFDEMYPEYGGEFCRVIHSKEERAEELIDNFKMNDGGASQITLAISVDMLDTGIDVPEVLNLVFAKPVKSKVKFWQMVGRGTRLCKDLFGPGQDKEKFLIFDHWGNFEYFELNHDEEEPTQTKSLSQKAFEAKLLFAEEALKQAAMPEFEQMIGLIKQDIDSLNDKSIAVRDNWRVKEQLSELARLKQFTPETKSALFDQMAPLMQWRNIQGQSETLRFDLDMMQAQMALLVNKRKNVPDSIQEVRQPIELKVRNLKMSMNQVRAQAKSIEKIQKDDFWQQASFKELEQVRVALRPIIQHREGTKVPPPLSQFIYDIKENENLYQVAERTTNIRTVDYEIYRQEVEKTLTPLFETDPVLQKIRAGQSISEQELDTLNGLVHTQNKQLDLKLLTEFFPESSVGVDELLRAIIGLDREAIEDKFSLFVQQHHLHLNSMQQRFISLLKSEICRTGSMTIARLYESPFVTLHQDGIDGLFKEQQASLIAEFVAGFTVQSGQLKNQVNQENNKPN